MLFSCCCSEASPDEERIDVRGIEAQRDRNLFHEDPALQCDPSKSVIEFAYEGELFSVTFTMRPLGMCFEVDQVPLVVTKMKEGSEAEQQGVKIGSVVQSVNGVKIQWLSYQECMSKISDSLKDLPTADGAGGSVVSYRWPDECTVRIEGLPKDGSVSKEAVGKLCASYGELVNAWLVHKSKEEPDFIGAAEVEFQTPEAAVKAVRAKPPMAWKGSPLFVQSLIDFRNSNPTTEQGWSKDQDAHPSAQPGQSSKGR